MSPYSFPVRINRYLALNGTATRKEADELIKKGLVFVNGKRAVIGYAVKEGDKVEVKKPLEEKKYFAFYKPRGLSTDELVISSKKIGLFPVGRLDKESEGLIILTNDGRITDRLLNPEHNHEKEYVVEVREKTRPGIIAIFEKGMLLDGIRLKKAKTDIKDEHTIRIVLSEGKKHQLRRMLSALRYTVSSLKRVRIEGIRLGNLKPGQTKKIEGGEKTAFLSSLNLPR